MTTTAIYARRSTEQQSASLERQVAECEDFIEREGWEVARAYSDSKSGWKVNAPRPGFDRMMRDARAGQFDRLVVWEVSRLSRQEGDDSALAVIWRLRKLGVEVHSVVERSTGNDLADDLTLLIRSYAAKDESDTKSKRVTSGKRRGVLNGVYQGANAPYGHRVAGRREHGGRLIKFYESDPAPAAVVRRIVDEYLRGESPQTIADGLTTDGVDPPRAGVNHTYARRNDPVWHQGSVRHLLANPLIAGFATYKGVRVKACPCASLEDVAAKGDRRTVAVETWNACTHEWVRSINVPGVLTPEVWERVQRVVTTRKAAARGRRGNYSGRGNNLDTASLFLLAGLVWCGNCNERIGIRADRRAGEVPKDFYRCRGRRIRRQCDLPHVARVELDEAIREHFVRHFVDAFDVQSTIEAQRERHLHIRSDRATLLREEIEAVEGRVAQDVVFRERYNDDYARGAITPEQWSHLEGEVGARVQQADAALTNLRGRLAEVEQDFTTEDVDRVLDHIGVIREMVQGRLTAQSTQALNLQLREVFEEFRISSRPNDAGTGVRLIVQPKLRMDWLPSVEGEATPRILDFADDDTRGIEVIDYLEPALRKVDLTDGLITYSS